MTFILNLYISDISLRLIMFHFTSPPLDVTLTPSFSPVILCGCVELAQEDQCIAEIAVGSPFSRFIPEFLSNRQSL